MCLISDHRPPGVAGSRAGSDAAEYVLDAWQRSVLFWDALRQRGDLYLEHRRAGKPAVLSFPYEMVLDGRTFDRPVNYALLRILPADGVPVDPEKRPFVIVDPRAGHGPGIGGSKSDSQVGIARRAGHAVYFVTFFPEPEPGQTLLDVAKAEAVFLETVADRHPDAIGRPCVIGNCQAGWAVAALAAVRPELAGPVILNGAPLSYWSGVRGAHPMRYSGGLLGGKWLASLAGDIGHGIFDGANLVANFEQLNPANTLWTKYHHLYANIDTEVPRFLDFERWWGGFFLMNAEEMDTIVSQLFIGNKLARGDAVTPDGQRIDLTNIDSPIIVFASFGDNITPPQQALNWIVDAFGTDEAILDDGQTIVVILHEDIGHLGIFVSGRVARKEHAELVGTLEMIDRLPPGLYEMIIEDRGREPGEEIESADPEPGDYTVRFALRTIDDILSIDDNREEEKMFQTVAQVSDLNDALYRTWMRPWVEAMTSDSFASALRHLHPQRAQRYAVSSLNPGIATLTATAPAVGADRRPAAADNPFLCLERTASEMIGGALDLYRDVRDCCGEAWFNWLYSPLRLGAVFPPTWSPDDQPSRELPLTPADETTVRDEAFENGSFYEAVMRLFLFAVGNRRFVDRRSMLITRALGGLESLGDAEEKAVLAEQAALLRLDQERAVEGLGKMLPTRDEWERAIALVQSVLMIDLDLEPPHARTNAEVPGPDPQERTPAKT